MKTQSRDHALTRRAGPRKSRSNDLPGAQRLFGGVVAAVTVLFSMPVGLAEEPDCAGVRASANSTTNGQGTRAEDSSEPRLYASGGLASSAFSTGSQGGLPGPVNGFGFAGGGGTGAEGAIGVALARPAGSLRLELEARGRQAGESPDVVGDAARTAAGATATWSTMANAWRDVSVTKRIGLYAGGGIGGGGVSTGTAGNGAAAIDSIPMTDASLGSTGMTGLAWQAGGGVTYAMNERVTLDFGYRYRGIEPAAGNGRVDGSEAILAVRIFEPFRDLWK
jgi:opacity protein-like surface antigen